MLVLCLGSVIIVVAFTISATVNLIRPLIIVRGIYSLLALLQIAEPILLSFPVDHPRLLLKQLVAVMAEVPREVNLPPLIFTQSSAERKKRAEDFVWVA